MGNYIGIDIGGTKSAVVLARVSGDEICMLERVAFATADCASTIDKFFFSIGEILKKRNIEASDIEAVGISSGGPPPSVCRKRENLRRRPCGGREDMVG